MTTIPSANDASNQASGSNPVPDIALCLSGGGYRAAIFHLGAMRWLNEIGWIPRIKKISSVSGGSIFAGHLAYRFREGWPTAVLAKGEWRARIEEPFWQFVQHDIRTCPALCRLIYWVPGMPSALSPAVRLAREYQQHLFDGNDLALDQLLESPEFVFCATDMTFGVNWEARRERVGDYMAGYIRSMDTDWTLSHAIAASSCFPPVFPPTSPRLPPELFCHGGYKKADRKEKLAGIRLTDGGVYDNLGLQPVFHEKKVLVSDGGGLMSFSMAEGFLRQMARYSELLQNGIVKLRREWIMRDFNGKPPVKEGTYWGIGDGAHRGPPFPNKEAAQQIAAIRTDLNVFTRAEFEILLNHGYLLAADSIIENAPQMLGGPIDPSSVTAPFPDWIDAARRERALRRSACRWWPRWLNSHA